MKTLRLISITKEQFDRTEFVPLNAEIDSSIMTEDDWTYGDVLENMEMGFEVAHETSWCLVYRTDDGYVTELID